MSGVILYSSPFIPTEGCKSFKPGHMMVVCQKKDLGCPNAQFITYSMPKIPGCPTASRRILQYGSQHAFCGCFDPQSFAQQKIHHITEPPREHKQMTAH